MTWASDVEDNSPPCGETIEAIAKEAAQAAYLVYGTRALEPAEAEGRSDPSIDTPSSAEARFGIAGHSPCHSVAVNDIVRVNRTIYGRGNFIGKVARIDDDLLVVESGPWGPEEGEGPAREGETVVCTVRDVCRVQPVVQAREIE